eukprot:COSAG01_NODE_7314_length_3255_cov_4.176489_2_plen_104_part_00
MASRKYCSDLVGDCRGPGGSRDAVNHKYKWQVPTRHDCQVGCDASPACTGYTYRADQGYCAVHGPGLDRDLVGGWSAGTDHSTTIGGTNGNPLYVCVVVAGRN